MEEWTVDWDVKNEQANAREQSWEGDTRQRKEQVQRHGGLLDGKSWQPGVKELSGFLGAALHSSGEVVSADRVSTPGPSSSERCDLDEGSCSVTQAGVQRCKHSSLQPHSPARSSYLSLPSVIALPGPMKLSYMLPCDFLWLMKCEQKPKRPAHKMEKGSQLSVPPSPVTGDCPMGLEEREVDSRLQMSRAQRRLQS
ncbi:hypothetical protein AAY473_012566 [Plecturocebus cupreus]